MWGLSTNMLQGGETTSAVAQFSHLLSWEGIQNYLYKDNLGIQPASDGQSSANFLRCDLDLWQFFPYAENKDDLLGCNTEGPLRRWLS